MARFSVPSASTSPTSSHRSAGSTGRRIPGSIFAAHTATPPPSVSFQKAASAPPEPESSRKRRAPSEPRGWSETPKRRAGSHSPIPLTRRRAIKYYGLPRTPSYDDAASEPRSSRSTSIVDRGSLPDYVSSGDDSARSNIIVPSHSSGHISNETIRKISIILTHENIASFEDDLDLPHGVPAVYRSAGTLAMLIHHRKLGAALPTSQNTLALPEMVCWHILLSLLRVVHYLHTGGRAMENNHIQARWQPIVHNAISPASISFPPNDPENEDADPNMYKPCKLGHLKRCVVLPRQFSCDNDDDEEALERREAFEGLFHPSAPTGFEAPEFVDPRLRHTPSPASDLWSIGAVLVAAMTSRTVWDLLLEADFLQKSTQSRKRRTALHERWQDVSVYQRLNLLLSMPTGTIAQALPKRYGKKLRIVVEILLDFNPEGRGIALNVLRDAEAFYRARRAEIFHEIPEPKIEDMFDWTVEGVDDSES